MSGVPPADDAPGNPSVGPNDRPLNEPPPERPVQPPPEGWILIWVPVTLLLVVGLFLGVRAIMGTGQTWAECQLRYVEATTDADSAQVDLLRLDPDGAVTCGAIRIERS